MRLDSDYGGKFPSIITKARRRKPGSFVINGYSVQYERSAGEGGPIRAGARGDYEESGLAAPKCRGL